ncbi:MAG: polymer-forming cytoskeletal protein [Bacteriovoracaceae bacterium]|nr:polymer-forming cytoskeletal protein [Bacteriovoracaceae bacterium]
MNIEDFKTSHFNIVGFGSKLNGEIHFEGRSSVGGDIKGQIIAAEKSLLIIEKTANVEGKIQGHDIEIHGTFKGELEAHGLLSLRPGCHVEGTLKAERIVIYPGAQINSETAAG